MQGKIAGRKTLNLRKNLIKNTSISYIFNFAKSVLLYFKLIGNINKNNNNLGTVTMPGEAFFC